MRRTYQGVLLSGCLLSAAACSPWGKPPPPWYDVRDFGANGFDLDDDSAAIQKAIDRAQEPDAQRRMVLIPTGTWYLDKPLVIHPREQSNVPRPLILFGTGIGATTLLSRKGEAAMAENEESAAAIAELRSHGVGEPKFYDLRKPRFMGD